MVFWGHVGVEYLYGLSTHSTSVCKRLIITVTLRVLIRLLDGIAVSQRE